MYKAYIGKKGKFSPPRDKRREKVFSKILHVEQTRSNRDRVPFLFPFEKVIPISHI